MGEQDMNSIRLTCMLTCISSFSQSRYTDISNTLIEIRFGRAKPLLKRYFDITPVGENTARI